MSQRLLRALGIAFVSTALCACHWLESGECPPDEVAHEDAGAAPVLPKAAEMGQVWKGLAPDERRMKVIVLPSDAAVEVDGTLVGRRGGAIELLGKVGEKRRVRASRGGFSTEKEVVIVEKQETALVLKVEPPPKPPKSLGKAGAPGKSPLIPDNPLMPGL